MLNKYITSGMIVFLFSAVGMGQSEVVLYKHSGFKGKRMVVQQDTARLGQTKIGDDQVSSIQVPHGCVVTLYEHSNFTGRQLILTESEADLGSRGFNDKLSSIRIARTEFPTRDRTPNGVVFFEHKNFEGDSDILTGDVSDMRRTRVGNDRLSSVIVPRGYRVELFEHINYQGRRLLLEADIADLRHAGFGNDIASSARITRIRRAPRHPAPGSITPPVIAGVTLYEHTGFRGKAATFSLDAPDLRISVVGNNKASSIRVPRGFEVILYSKKNFRGNAVTLRGDSVDLAKTKLGNDRVSSLRVRRTH